MPEIAEVRVVANVLKKELLGKKIKKIEVLYSNIIESNKDEFIKCLTNQTFTDIKTYGKYLIFSLGDYSFLAHLRMEGKFYYVPSKEEITKHTHVIFNLDNGYDLRYNDTRKFGKMKLVKTDDIYEDASIKKLGPEADSNSLTADYLLGQFSKKKQPIKSALLDQTVISGLGNIYANEVLFASKINPLRESNSITSKEVKSIIDNSKRIVTKSFECGGCTIRSYTSSLGVIGHYQDYLCVQSREGESCPVCKTPIKRIKIDGRSTFYCEKCQK